MGQHETTAARRGSLKRKLEPEFEDRKEDAKVLSLEPRVHRHVNIRHSAMELPKEVNSNPAITNTSFSMASPTLPSPCPSVCNYDVFLSFKGEDTRKNFTDHLYSALMRVGIHTFRDEGELPRGEIISTELHNVIHGSKVSIVVFSKGYAYSKWCLNELVEIIHCAKIRGQTLLPIFYHVDPSDIRKQTGTFADAFARHEELFKNDMERVEGWRAALTEACSRSGLDIKEVANGYEARLIDQIVKEVLSKLKPAEYLDVAIHPVGVNSRVEEMKALLNLETSDVRIVGIYGMGGIGKTTIAKAVYNQIRDTFEGSSCLIDIKEKSEQLVRLQKQLLFDILKMKKFRIDSVDRGIRLIQERIQGRRVLVVLDDVDDLKQIYALVGQCKWFGPGSRVIITTRNEHLLTQAQVNGKYEVRKLDVSESLQLFSWHAFGMAHPTEDYLDLSYSAMKYAGGLPLALEVLGCFLFRRSVIEWKSELEILQKMPHDKIHKILKRSFDSLDHNRKIIFLDIACFFVRVEKEYVIAILDGCGFSSISGINILVQRALLRIDMQHKLVMHDLIRDMGREIVREESDQYPGKRSRLWFRNDVLSVLHKDTGSKAVQGLILYPFDELRDDERLRTKASVGKGHILNSPELKEENMKAEAFEANGFTLHLPGLKVEHLKTEAFANMQNLRLLQINAVHLTGSFEYLSKELRWLCWHVCPLKFLPKNFHLENLVVLEMRYNNLTQIWEGNRILNSLKFLNLSYSRTLIKLPDFLQVPHLEILLLDKCVNLVELHESIKHLKGLVSLSLRGCKKVRNLPESISNLTSLEILNLSGCLKLDKLPEKLGNLTTLKKFFANSTAIKQLPSSFSLLKNLKAISLFGHEGTSLESWLSCFSSWISSPKCFNPLNLVRASVVGFYSLGNLVLNNCNLSEAENAIDLGGLPSLRELDLSKNKFCKLPQGIGLLSKLGMLRLENCASLHSISELPAKLRILFANGCSSMERLSLSPSSQLFGLSLNNCSKLVEIQGLNLEPISFIEMIGCDNLPSNFRINLLQYPSTQSAAPRLFCLPGHENLNSPQLQVMIHNKSRGYHHVLVRIWFDDCVGISQNLFLSQAHVIRNKLKTVDFPEKEMEMVSGEEIEVSFNNSSSADIEVSKCGVHLLLEKPNVIDNHGSMVQYLSYDTAKNAEMSAAAVDDEISFHYEVED
ncbi:disease resistance protein RPV1-like isoform X2 [Carya illinoinensis]|uniref:disease resistance protein RPV1-like isoform X2 n=1 Tax=Carya illinoinensis TaxID=32201 RepID=UPI001C7283A7|nr:disease resistance protein RPV1-like isoform X2 [Carya illinoinensis]